jgi:uncharacterized protein YutE (UPF0331/DUF86 family)
LIAQSKIDAFEQSYSSIQNSVVSIYTNNAKKNGQYEFPKHIARKFERNDIITEQKEYEQNIAYSNLLPRYKKSIRR